MTEEYYDGWHSHPIPSVLYTVCVKEVRCGCDGFVKTSYHWRIAWHTRTLKKAIAIKAQYESGMRRGGELGVRIARETREFVKEDT